MSRYHIFLPSRQNQSGGRRERFERRGIIGDCLSSGTAGLESRAAGAGGDGETGGCDAGAGETGVGDIAGESASALTEGTTRSSTIGVWKGYK